MQGQELPVGAPVDHEEGCGTNATSEHRNPIQTVGSRESLDVVQFHTQRRCSLLPVSLLSLLFNLTCLILKTMLIKRNFAFFFLGTKTIG